jgi:hypothetical protein
MSSQLYTNSSSQTRLVCKAGWKKHREAADCGCLKVNELHFTGLAVRLVSRSLFMRPLFISLGGVVNPQAVGLAQSFRVA